MGLPACGARRRDATVPAPRRRRGRAAMDLCQAALLFALIAATSPATAQLAGNLSLASEARLRGRPVSDHRPVAELELVHDGAGGFYLGGSAALVASPDAGLRPFAFKQYAGFARRLSSGTTIDLGLVHNGYTEYSDVPGGGSYTEAYVGIIGRNLSGRLFLSPAYFRKRHPTLYMEMDGHLDLTRNSLVFVHAGRLIYLREGGAMEGQGSATDWRLGLRRRIGAVTLEAAWHGYAQDMRRYGSYRRTGDALVIALLLAL